MKRPSPAVERLIFGTVLTLMFLLLASVFVPDLGHAQHASPIPPDQPSIAAPSTDPHEGLPSLGTIEDDRFIVHIYGGASDPLYSVYDRLDGSELAVLLTAEQAQQQFPELPIVEMDFGTDSPLMLAEPERMEFMD
ncbi:MAG: hypothetical protein GY715_17290 [Planctomycetes bacterium]|nr:hypothetical protein [Planctomycetota bacterium]